jgi:hypothetical protein
MSKVSCPFCGIRLRVDRGAAWEEIRVYLAVHLRRCDTRRPASAGEARMIAISIANDIVGSRSC